jgi:uncharacterized protein
MANDIFVDTSGFYSLLIKDEAAHVKAKAILVAAGKKNRCFFTTDYVLDETATLLKARGKNHLLNIFFESFDGSRAVRIEWTDSNRFQNVQQFFLKHSDKEWSFTDCHSFCVMREMHIREALAKDAHFVQAGFIALLL